MFGCGKLKIEIKTEEDFRRSGLTAAVVAGDRAVLGHSQLLDGVTGEESGPYDAYWTPIAVQNSDLEYSGPLYAKCTHGATESLRRLSERGRRCARLLRESSFAGPEKSFGGRSAR